MNPNVTSGSILTGTGPVRFSDRPAGTIAATPRPEASSPASRYGDIFVPGTAARHLSWKHPHGLNVIGGCHFPLKLSGCTIHEPHPFQVYNAEVLKMCPDLMSQTGIVSGIPGTLLWIHPSLESASDEILEMMSVRINEKNETPDGIAYFPRHVGRSIGNGFLTVGINGRNVRFPIYLTGTGKNPKPEDEYQKKRDGRITRERIVEHVTSAAMIRAEIDAVSTIAFSRDVTGRYVQMRLPETVLRVTDFFLGRKSKSHLEQLRTLVEDHIERIRKILGQSLTMEEYFLYLTRKNAANAARGIALGFNYGTQLRPDNMGMGQLVDMQSYSLGFEPFEMGLLKSWSMMTGRLADDIDFIRNRNKRLSVDDFPHDGYPAPCDIITELVPEIDLTLIRKEFLSSFYRAFDAAMDMGIRLSFPEKDLRFLGIYVVLSMFFGYQRNGTLSGDMPIDQILEILSGLGHIDNSVPSVTNNHLVDS